MKYLLLITSAASLSSCCIVSGFSGASLVSMHSASAGHLSSRGEEELFQKFEYYLQRSQQENTKS